MLDWENLKNYHWPKSVNAEAFSLTSMGAPFEKMKPSSSTIDISARVAMNGAIL